MNKVSEHITYADAIRSDIAKKNGVNNYFTPDQLANMKVLAEKIYEPLYNHFNIPIFIVSFFRNKEVNRLLKGSSTSQHLANNGAAIDLDADVYGGITNSEIFHYIKDNLIYDQLIWEFGTDVEPSWVHVSYNENKNRGQIFIAYRDEVGKVKYKNYI